MTAIDYIILAAVAAALVLALRHISAGKGGCGGDCSACGGGCSGHFGSGVRRTPGCGTDFAGTAGYRGSGTYSADGDTAAGEKTNMK